FRSNTGPRVPPEEAGGLFEPFRRAGGRARAGGGAGLGLSIVAAIARAHGGEVEARAREAGGLSVRVCLPAILCGRPPHT
ncbi:MAG: two-component sensor histidine kinase, partial [Catenulispora sp.]|nr:two-component sensor histidine kinase [Catenulispora sp.]